VGRGATPDLDLRGNSPGRSFAASRPQAAAGQGVDLSIGFSSCASKVSQKQNSRDFISHLALPVVYVYLTIYEHAGRAAATGRRRGVDSDKAGPKVCAAAFPKGYPTRRDAAVGRALLRLAVGLHGRVRPSADETGHGDRLRAHRRRVLAGARRERARRRREFRQWRQAQARAQAVRSARFRVLSPKPSPGSRSSLPTLNSDL